MRLPCSAWELHSGMGARTRVVLVDQDRRLAEIDVCPIAIDARRWRRNDAQEIRPKIVHAHGTVRCRPTHHVGGLAEVEGIANISIVPAVGARSTGLVTARRALPGGSRRSCEG